MNSLLFLMAGAGVTILFAIRENRKLRKVFNAKTGKTGSFLPKAVSLLLVSAQLSELLKIVNEASVMHLVAALFFLAMVAAGQSGTESEWR